MRVLGLNGGNTKWMKRCGYGDGMGLGPASGGRVAPSLSKEIERKRERYVTILKIY